jgi:hypothetical protein
MTERSQRVDYSNARREGGLEEGVFTFFLGGFIAIARQPRLTNVNVNLFAPVHKG